MANIVLICGDWLFLEENSLGETLSNVLYVHFYTDYQLAAAGFELTYDHIKGRGSKEFHFLLFIEVKHF